MRALAGMRARVHTLEFDSNFRLGCAGVKQILASPELVSMVNLSMQYNGVDLPLEGGEPAWPWQEVCTCALTALQTLHLAGNDMRDTGTDALALHIGALVQLRVLNIGGCGITKAGALAQKVFLLPRLEQLVGRWQLQTAAV